MLMRYILRDIKNKTVIAVVCFCSSFLLLLPLLIISLIVFLSGLLIRESMIQRLGFNMLISVDQFGNVALLGDPDETISSRAGRAHLSGKPIVFASMMRKFVDKLFHVLFGERDHCVNAVEEKAYGYEKEIWDWITPE